MSSGAAVSILNLDAARIAQEKDRDLRRLIRRHYHTDKPSIAYICGGLRRVAVDPTDKRAQLQLLRHGVKYFSKMQAVVYSLNAFMKPDLFIDVGVNYGECLFALPLFSKTKVIGFEANPHLMPLLERSLRYNDDLQNVSLVAKAVSDRAEVLTFKINPRWSGKSRVVEASNSRGGRLVSVEATTLDDELLGIADDWKLALVKIDVEGLEQRVLKGAKKLNELGRNIIYLVEYDSQFIGETAEQVFRWYTDQFEVFVLQRKGLDRVGSYQELQAVTGDQGRCHCDLLLLKTDSVDVREQLRQKLGQRSLSGIAKRNCDI